jgi:hypothetical protein
LRGGRLAEHCHARGPQRSACQWMRAIRPSVRRGCGAARAAARMRVAGCSSPLTLVRSRSPSASAKSMRRRCGAGPALIRKRKRYSPSTGQKARRGNTLRARCLRTPGGRIQQVAVALAEGVVHLDHDSAQRTVLRDGSTRSSRLERRSPDARVAVQPDLARGVRDALGCEHSSSQASCVAAALAVVAVPES